MQGILDIMLSVYDNVRTGGSYLILMLASLYVLYRVNAKKNQWFIYYALFCLVLVCANPVLVFILSKAFPVLGWYTQFLLFVPVLFYIPFAAAETFEKVYHNKQAAMLLAVFVLVIGISGNLYGLYQDDKVPMERYGSAQKKVVECIREEQPSLVVADDSLLPFLRRKAPEISLLYGRDLYQLGLDLGIIDVYSEELQHLHSAMRNPEGTIRDILAIADMYGCDMVVVKSFENAPAKEGHFTKTADTGTYIVYSVQ